MILPASRWVCSDSLAGRCMTPHHVTVLRVTPGKHNIDKGPTATPPDDDVHFTLDDLNGRETCCGQTAFLHTYVAVGS